MSSLVRENTFPVIGSVAIHGLIVAAMMLAARFTFDHPAPAFAGATVEAVAIDSRVLQALQSHKQQEVLDRERRADAERALKVQQDAEQAQQAKQQADDQARREAADAQQAEKARAAEQASAAEVAKAAAQAATAKAATDAHLRQVAQQRAALQQQQLQQAELQRRQLDKQQSEQAKAAVAAQAAKQKLAEEQRQRADRESELRRQLADEEHVSAVEASPLRDRYIASIQNRITRAWLKPESAHSGILCRIDVTQIPGGEVTKAIVTDCNGDDAVRQSIENAVYRASPLPEPADPALFQRNLTLVFKPND